MKAIHLSCISVLCIFLMSCKKSSDVPTSTDIQLEYNFTTGTEGWIGDFADYPNEPGVVQFYQMEFTHSGLPNPLNAADGSLKISGNNHSDDLFMFIKKKVSGFEPGRSYTANIKVDFATNVANNMIGIGGSPGEGVSIKVGAVPIEPMRVLNQPENWFRLNIDKGNQSTSGTDMKVIGNFANGTNANTYVIKQLSTSAPITVKANAQGEIWVVIGTDSGFEGRTTIYYTSVVASFK